MAEDENDVDVAVCAWETDEVDGNGECESALVLTDVATDERDRVVRAAEDIVEGGLPLRDEAAGLALPAAILATDEPENADASEPDDECCATD